MAAIKKRQEIELRKAEETLKSLIAKLKKFKDKHKLAAAKNLIAKVKKIKHKLAAAKEPINLWHNPKKTLYKKEGFKPFRFDGKKSVADQLADHRKKSSAEQLANQWAKLNREQQHAAMEAMKKAGIPTRRRIVGALKTEGNNRTIKQLKSKMRKMKAKMKLKSSTSKWNKEKPASYLSANEWHALSDDQKKAARAEREKQGIPQRQISAIKTSKVAALKLDSDDESVEVVTPPIKLRRLQRVPPGYPKDLIKVPPGYLKEVEVG